MKLRNKHGVKESKTKNFICSSYTKFKTVAVGFEVMMAVTSAGEEVMEGSWGTRNVA